MNASSGNKRAALSESRPRPGGATFNRRSFVKRALTAGAAASAAGLSLGPTWPEAEAAPGAATASGSAWQRRQQAYQVRQAAALSEFNQPLPAHPDNGDETLYPNKIGSYSKGLAHNALGEVDLEAYNALLVAVSTGRREDFEAIPLGGTAKLTNPQSGLAFDLEGPDSHSLFQPPAPALASRQAAGELAELYWMALARDVHFLDYGADATIAAAAAELSRFSDFRGPKTNGQVTPDTVFRGNTPGDLAGPWLSQFLWLDIPQGTMVIPQKLYTRFPGVSYLTSYD